jgi:hypothetical protein
MRKITYFFLMVCFVILDNCFCIMQLFCKPRKVLTNIN